LATINADGSPHVTGVGAVWAEGTFWFQTGERTLKARNLARDPRCTLGVAMREFDLVVEGEAEQVTDPPIVAAMAERWAAEGWPCRVDETGRALTADYSALSRTPAVVRLPHHPPVGDRARDPRARRRDPVVLSDLNTAANSMRVAALSKTIEPLC
jgi:hypothetical protein